MNSIDMTKAIARRLLRQRKRIFARLWSAILRVRNVVSSSSILGDAPIVVSLTSYGYRIDQVHVAIESMGRGAIKPKAMILWLNDVNKVANPPVGLRRLQTRGLEIRFTPDLGPHKKYYPYVLTENDHQLPLVTADDDVLYPRHWLQRLQRAALAHPDDINCFWANRMSFSGNTIDQYSRWKPCRTTERRRDNFAVGVSGVLYPPAMLNSLRERGTRFLDVSPMADDIWLHWVALQSGVLVRQVSKTPHHFPLIPGTQKKSLASENVSQGGNDRRIEALYGLTDRVLLLSP